MLAWEATPVDLWIRDELLRRVLNQELINVIVVLAGRRLPNFDPPRTTYIGEVSMNTLGPTDVEEYLRVRLGLQAITQSEAQRLYQAIDGIPQLLGVVGDNLVRRLHPALEDELW
jgi:hypothetical protein